MPLTVALVVGALPFGGVESLYLDLAKKIKAFGHNPIVINVAGVGEMDYVFKEHGFPPIHVGESDDCLKTTNFFTTIKLRSILKEIKPDVIHTSHFSANYHCRLAAIKLGVPVIVHWHNIKKINKIHRNIAEKLLSYATDLHLGVAESVVEQAVAPHNVAKRPVAVLYNAIDDKVLSKAQEVSLEGLTNQEGPILFSVCRLVKQKRMDLLISAFKLIKQKYTDASLVIVGEGREKKHLEQLATALGLEKDVCFTGYRSDVFNIMKAFSKRKSLFIAPSEYEGFGLALLEAFYFGIPAVISPFVPIKEIGGKAVCECLLDVEELAKGIEAILKNDQLYKEMKHNAKAVADSNTMENMVGKLVSIYEGLA